jgi:hypothetical protein
VTERALALVVVSLRADNTKGLLLHRRNAPPVLPTAARNVHGAFVVTRGAGRAVAD